MKPHPLVGAWQEEAARLRRKYGVTEAAQTLLSCAADLEASERARGLEALTLREAAGESGYTTSALEKKQRRGEIPNAGNPDGGRRVLRRDLPYKPGRAFGSSSAPPVQQYGANRPAGRPAVGQRRSREEPDLAGRVLLERERKRRP